MPPVGSIIIVTYNSALHIDTCLRSVNEPEWERIVVDNASQDGTAGRARAVPRTEVVANSANRGFAAAANQGAGRTSGNLLFFLNPDVTARPGALAALREAAADASVAAVAGRLENSDGTAQVGFTVRRLPTVTDALAEVLLLNRVWPGNPINRNYRCLDFDHERAAAVEQPAGACLLVKREAWEALGGFDEQFFPLWFEDVDLCRRLRERGWRVRYEPRARFEHAGGHSLAAVSSPERQLFWYTNLLRYFRKHHSRRAVAGLRVGILCGMLLRIAITALGKPPGADKRRVYVEGYTQVIRRCVLRSAA